jgi:hypothetical protein
MPTELFNPRPWETMAVLNTNRNDAMYIPRMSICSVCQYYAYGSTLFTDENDIHHCASGTERTFADIYRQFPVFSGQPFLSPRSPGTSYLRMKIPMIKIVLKLMIVAIVRPSDGTSGCWTSPSIARFQSDTELADEERLRVRVTK